MSVPTPRDSRHDGGRWETVRSAIASNPSTFRLCLILLVTYVPPAVIVALIQHHVL
jgi:hypothetical protein